MSKESLQRDSGKSVLLRGNQQLAPGELTGHLALALRLENVAVLLGSGTSVCAGGSTMGGIWDDLIKSDKTLSSWLAKQHFIENEGSAPPNVEELLSKLEIALQDATRRRDETKELLERKNQILRGVVSAAMLDATLWGERDEAGAQELLKPYLRLLAKLQGSRQPGQSAPWAFTTNYDLSLEWAAEQHGIHIVNGYAGLHERRFQPNAFDLSLQNTNARGEARFGSYNLNLVKLHGSLSWTLSEKGDAVELPCSYVKPDLDSFMKAEKGAELESLLIHPSAAKYFDTVGFIYGELVRRFTEYLSRPNTTLIVCGYGFGDAHLNRLLASGLLNPTLQLIIYYPEWDDPESDPKNEFVRHLLSLGLPRVIVRGGGKAAHFEQFVEDLPETAMVDELSPEAKRLLNQISKGVGVARQPDAEP